MSPVRLLPSNLFFSGTFHEGVQVASIRLSSFSVGMPVLFTVGGCTPLNANLESAFSKSGPHSPASLSLALKSDVIIRSRVLRFISNNEISYIGITHLARLSSSKSSSPGPGMT